MEKKSTKKVFTQQYDTSEIKVGNTLSCTLDEMIAFCIKAKKELSGKTNILFSQQRICGKDIISLKYDWETDEDYQKMDYQNKKYIEAADKIAREAADSTSEYNLVRFGFVNGCIWMRNNQWCDASNDLPCNHPELIEEDNPNYTYDVLCKSEKGTLYVDYMFQSRISKEWKWSTENGFDCKRWMPIPSLPNI